MAILAPSLTLGITSGFKIHILRCCDESPGTRLQLETTEELLVPTEATPIHLKNKNIDRITENVLGTIYSTNHEKSNRISKEWLEVVEKVVESWCSTTYSQDVSTCPIRRNNIAKIKDSLFITLLVQSARIFLSVEKKPILNVNSLSTRDSDSPSLTSDLLPFISSGWWSKWKVFTCDKSTLFWHQTGLVASLLSVVPSVTYSILEDHLYWFQYW